eukprot:gb/GEZN01000069.1/.p1 GENE.gb/GEZN01000069.1/~~gb/GEZN01000069.1/.p1  ORF type:complete len:2536 (-),score=350.23 gb/GEZN01000069.1/:442-7830(-)
MLDHTFFGMNGPQAERIDPQIYLLMETATEALVDSGLMLDDIADSETGVYVGACFSDMHGFTLQNEEGMTGYEHTGCAKAMFANRISYAFNLHGPSMTIDTACSSSLVALVQAFNDLQSGRCTTALVGGSSLILDPAGCVGFNKFQMLAPDGHCKSFDQAGDGFVRADGIVSLFLTTDPKFVRLMPHAQLLSAETNAVGRHAKGITFPCGIQQGKLYRRTFSRANLNPLDVQYIEAHGTGTKAGDHEELEGIKNYFGDRSSLTVGSIKSNVGHCEGCSGLAGLAKVLLMLEEKTYYPQLHIHNPHLDIGELSLVTEARPFKPQELKGFRAVVSSYGFGGANACVVVADVRQPPPHLSQSSSSFVQPVFPHLTLLSHRTEEGLEAWQKLLPVGHQPPITSDVMRFPYRGTGPHCDNEWGIGPVGVPNERTKSLLPVYLVLTGNGSQWGGMGRDLMKHSFFRAVLERCGSDIPELVSAPELKSDVVSQTRALTAIQIALIELLRAYEVAFAGVVAHSAGEIAAGYAAGAYDLETTMRIAIARGAAADLYTARNAKTPGGMLAVAADAKTVEQHLLGSARIACYNAPSSVTVSGLAADIKATAAQLKKHIPDVKCKILEGIRVPYHHSSLLGPQTKELARDLQACCPGRKAFPAHWFSAVSGFEGVADFSYDYHLQSVLRPVDFPSACAKIPAKSIVLEVGPHGIMRPYLTELLPEATYISMMAKNKPGLQTAARGLAELWVNGAELQAPVTPIRLPLPVRAAAVSWHRREFKLLDYKAKASAQSGGGKDFTFDLDGKDSYLRDHFIDGRAIFPATGYIYVLAQAFGKYPQTIHDFKILRPVILYDPEVTLRVSVLQNGEATVCYNDEVVATGRVATSQNQASFVNAPDTDNIPPSDRMDSSTFYQLTTRHGYEYKEEFQGLKQVVLVGGDSYQSLGRIDSPYPIAFLDAMLQLSLLNGLSGLRLPTEIRQISLSGPVPPSAWVENDSCLGRVSGGGISFEGLETSVAPRAPKASPVQISFTQEELLWTGRVDYSSPRHAYLHHLMRYGLALLRQQPGANRHQRAQSVTKIMTKHDPTLAQAPDLRILESTPDNYMYQILTQSYAAGKFLEDPIKALAATSLLDKIYAENLGFDLTFMEKCLSVARSHTERNLLNFFEIGTGTGGFFKIISSFIHPQDTLVTTDREPQSRFVHDDATLKLEFQFQTYDLNAMPSKQVEETLMTTDVLIAHNALHVADDLQASLSALTSRLQPGGFVLLYECTSPFYLTSFGLDETTWGYKDERSFGLWLSVPEWLKQFASAGLQVVAYSSSQEDIATVFFCRKVVPSPAPTPLYLRADQEAALPVAPTTPTVYVTEPLTGMHGFARTLAREGYPVSSVERLDDDKTAVPQRILQEAHRLGLRTCVYSAGKLGTHVHTKLQDQLTRPLLASTRGSNSAQAVHVEVSVPGDLNSLVLIQTPRRAGTRVCIAYSALNFRDVMLASNKINKSTFKGFSRHGSGVGLEFSGVSEAGKRVMGFGLDAIGNVIDSEYVWDIPSGLTLEQGATIPVVYLTVYYAFYRAKLSAGQSVLIHAGTGGVGQAAIRVAHSLGAEIFTTCNSTKRAHLLKLFPFLSEDHIGDSRSSAFEATVMRGTQGKGVHAVLNSLAGELLMTGFRCVRQHGYFLEIGKFDLMKNTPIGMNKFLSNVTFVGIDIDQVFEVPAEMVELSRRFQAGLVSGVVQPLEATIFPFARLPEAMKYLASGRHTGKVVIDMAELHGECSRELKAQPSPAPQFHPRFFTHGTHLVTGGLGGFGLELAKWLAERGASHLVLATRAGGKVNSAHQQLVLQSLRRQCKVTVVARDLADRAQVQSLGREVGQLTGIWHLAMVLNDCLFKDMTPARWEGTLRPKSTMGEELNALARTTACESFVCFSSITSKNGNAGQSNYAYCNNVLEQLCRRRRSEGLQALAVQWGAIGDVGFVARHKNHSALMSTMTASGIDSQPIASCLQYLETALLSSNSSPVVSSSRQASRVKSEDDESATGASGSADLLQVVGKILQVDLHQFGEDTKLAEVGLDSLSSAVCHAAICRATGSTFPLTEMSSMTIGRLIALQGKVRAPTAPAKRQPARRKKPTAGDGATTAEASPPRRRVKDESGKVSELPTFDTPTKPDLSPTSLVKAFPSTPNGTSSTGGKFPTQYSPVVTLAIESLEVQNQKVICHHPPPSNESRNNGYKTNPLNGGHVTNGHMPKVSGRYYFCSTEPSGTESTFVLHRSKEATTIGHEDFDLWALLQQGEKYLEPEPRNQMLFSMIHSILAVLINFWAVSRADRSSGFALPFLFSLVWLFFDVLLYHKVMANDRTAQIHHLLFAGVCIWCIGNATTEAALTTTTLVACFEVSTIFFNAYYLFRQEWLFFTFAVTFSLFRVFIGGLILVPQAVYHMKESYLFASVCGLSVYLLQLYWFKGIVFSAQRRYNGTHKKRLAVKIQ